MNRTESSTNSRRLMKRLASAFSSSPSCLIQTVSKFALYLRRLSSLPSLELPTSKDPTMSDVPSLQQSILRQHKHKRQKNKILFFTDHELLYLSHLPALGRELLEVLCCLFQR